MLLGLFVATAKVKLTNTEGEGQHPVVQETLKYPTMEQIWALVKADRYQVRNDLVVNQRLSATVQSEEFLDSHYLW